MIYKVGIVGYGVVGKGIHRMFEHRVKSIYDPYVTWDSMRFASQFGYGAGALARVDDPDEDIEEELKKELYSKTRDFKYLDAVFVCVMTKEDADGHCDSTIVEEAVAWLTELNPNLLIIVKSALVPSEAERIKKEYSARLVVSPEYMGESKYFTPFWLYPDPKDAKMHDFHIFGGDSGDTSICVDLFIRVVGPHAKYYQTDVKTASLTKYMENSFFAAKVTFCNEWYDIAKTFGVDYNELRELWLADSRVSPMHTAVFPLDRGYGGKCFPKDVRAIVADSKEAGYAPELMETIDERNKVFREDSYELRGEG